MTKLMMLADRVMTWKAAVLMIIIAANQLDGREVAGGLETLNMLGSALGIQGLFELLVLMRERREEEVQS